MKSKLFASILILTLVIIGCGDDPVTNPDEGVNENKGTITLSGAASGSYNAVVGFLNGGDAVAITLSDSDNKVNLLLTSDKTTTGTFSVPDEYSVIYTNDADSVLSEMHVGSVKIDKIGTTSVTGSFNASGYPLSLKTFLIDSSKVITINATFSL